MLGTFLMSDWNERIQNANILSEADSVKRLSEPQYLGTFSGTVYEQFIFRR